MSSVSVSQYVTTPPSNVQPGKPLFGHQASMPHLPVPTLRETLQKYLVTVRPLLSDEEYRHTEKAVAEFARAGGQGEVLQKRLEPRAREQPHAATSWLAEWWTSYAYMSYRDPVVHNVNYFFQFIDDRRPQLHGVGSQVPRAAQIVQAALAFRASVLSQELQPEMARSTPLCSVQYNYLFHSCRVPAPGDDVTATFDPNDQENHFFVVARKNRFYKVPFSEGMSTAEIEAQLNRIVQQADALPPALSIGALTAAHRDVWTAQRARLVQLGNEASLRDMERAAFLLCLDDTSPVTREEVSRALWHGDGRNRWFDKHCEFVVFANGKAGFNGEHSMMDATPTGRMCEWMLDALFKGKVDHGATHVAVSSLPQPEELVFQVDAGVAGAVREAEAGFDKVCAEHDLQVCYFHEYGKNFIKKCGVSPDAYVQMALQLGYYKMHGYCRATYESAQTRKFAFGRTETGRSVSNESMAFVRAMTDAHATPAERVAKLKAAIEYHGKYMKEASEGKGVDRHLLGLRLLLQPGEPKPAIFSDPAFAKSCHWQLSTSQLTSELYDGYGWGEVVPDGYGLAYMIKERSVHVNIVSRHLHNQRLRHYIIEALQEMREAFEAVGVGASPTAGKSKL